MLRTCCGYCGNAPENVFEGTFRRHVEDMSNVYVLTLILLLMILLTLTVIMRILIFNMLAGYSQRLENPRFGTAGRRRNRWVGEGGGWARRVGGGEEGAFANNTNV